jgi:hypothetical protein
MTVDQLRTVAKLAVASGREMADGVLTTARKLAETNANSQYYRPYRSLRSLKGPAGTVLLFDADVGGDRISFKGRWRYKSPKGDDVNYRHVRSSNFLLNDFHVENLGKDTVEAKSLHNEPLVWQPHDVGPWDPTGRIPR